MIDDGHARARDMVRRITRAEDEAMGTLSPDEQEQLVALTRRLTDNIIILIDDPALALEEE